MKRVFLLVFLFFSAFILSTSSAFAVTNKTISDFGFSEVISDNLPQYAEGYVCAWCDYASNYVCPTGYTRTSCAGRYGTPNVFTVGDHNCCAFCAVATVRCDADYYCGDGIKNGSESCDGSDGCSASEACSSDCETCLPTSSCGNGVIEGGEVCDSGLGCNSGEMCNSSCDACECLLSCSSEGYNCGTYTFCGSSVICGSCVSGESCVSGVCMPSFCGDGIVNGSEVCDINDSSSCSTGETCEMGCDRCISGLIWNKRLVKDRVQDLVEFILGTIGSIVFLVFVFSGILYASASGDSDRISTAKKIFMNALYGLILVLLSYSFLILMDKILTQ